MRIATIFDSGFLMTNFTAPSLRWLETILQERFGHHFKINQVAEVMSLSIKGSDNQICFDNLQPSFHKSVSDIPCTHWDALKEGFEAPIHGSLPAPARDRLIEPLIVFSKQGATVHYDILGLVYWMLTRLEEIGRTDLDIHDRFPATSSHAFKNNYLERPIVDEWLIILRQVIQRVWPQLHLKTNQYEMKVSHDVDIPARYSFQPASKLIRAIGRDVIIRKDIKSAIKAPWVWLNSSEKIHHSDPANTFNWLMSQSEDNGLISAFYFICGRTNPAKDALYDPEMPQIRRLMNEIHIRGHEIGLHPSYNTYNSPEEIAREASRLHQVCMSEGIEQPEWGGRMHFLRWDQAVTLKAWADAGMNYDSTLGYADSPGFRCGTCFEYPAFDLLNDQQLPIRVRPLVAMDCTVMADKYLGLGSTWAAYEKFAELKSCCRQVGGVFTLLWHNSHFSCSFDFDIYRELVSS